jgi:phospholipid N-methyltransferase
VVEFGPGTACLTRIILDRLPGGATLLAFEINEDFVRLLERELPHPRLVVINDSAEKIEEYLRKHGFSGADYIFSGLPFTTMPAPVRGRILDAAHRALTPAGKFIIYQYSPYLLRMLRAIFGEVKTSFELRNIPPAFCFVCSK